MNLIGKKTISTSLADARFLKGQSLIEAFNEPHAFGAGPFKMHFDDGTFLSVEIVEDPEGEKILALHIGAWRDNDGVIEELT